MCKFYLSFLAVRLDQLSEKQTLSVYPVPARWLGLRLYFSLYLTHLFVELPSATKLCGMILSVQRLF